MKKTLLYLKKILQHELIKGSTYIFLGSAISIFLAFVLYLFLPRFLTIKELGEYAAILSIVTLLTTPAQSIGLAIIRYSADYVAKKDYQKAISFYKSSFFFLFLVATAIFVLFIVSMPIIKTFFHTYNSFYMLIAACTIWLTYVGITNSSFLQGTLHFKFSSITVTIGGVIRAGLGILLLYLGFHVAGVLVSYFLCFFFPFLLTFFPLKKYIFGKWNMRALPIREIILYAIPSGLTIFSLSSLTSTDIILVKHFFSAKDAGLYGELSLIGKSIFYITAPIGSVMFPLLIKRKDEGTNFQNLFYLSVILVLLPSLGMTFLFFLFPKFFITIFTGGKDYIVLIPYIGWFALFLSVFNVLNLMVNFFLSLKHTKISLMIIVGALLQFFGIFLFHSSFSQIIFTSLTISIVLLVVLLIYYWKIYAKKNFFKKIGIYLPYRPGV